jgi:PPOX class probable F420-dependent enzyme
MRLSPDEARRRFARSRVARLSTVSAQGQPHIVPFTFAVDADQIYSAVDGKPKSTTDLRRLRNIAASPLVTVIADHYDDDWSALWWARADGRAMVTSDPAAMAAPVRLLAGRYRQYADSPPAGPLIVITVDRWTGWSAS